MAVTKDYDFDLDGYLLQGLTEITGLDLPEIDVQITSRSGAHGSYTSGRYFKERVITLTGRITSTPDVVAQAEQLLNQAFMPRDADVAFSFKMPNLPIRYAGVKPQNLRYKIGNIETAVGIVDFIGTLVAGDPRIYSTAQQTLTLGPGIPTAGSNVASKAFPITFGSGDAGYNTRTNAGNIDALPTVTFTGPLYQPTISNLTTGESFQVLLDIPAGGFVTVDSYNRTVVFNGASRYSSIAAGSIFPRLIPGANTFSVNASVGTGTATITFRDTWA